MRKVGQSAGRYIAWMRMDAESQQPMSWGSIFAWVPLLASVVTHHQAINNFHGRVRTMNSAPQAFYLIRSSGHDVGARACTHKSRSMSDSCAMSALPPKADIHRARRNV